MRFSLSHSLVVIALMPISSRAHAMHKDSSCLQYADFEASLIEKTDSAFLTLEAWNGIFDRVPTSFALEVLKIFKDGDQGLANEIDQLKFVAEVHKRTRLEPITIRRYVSNFVVTGILRKIRIRDESGIIVSKSLAITDLGLWKYAAVAGILSSLEESK